MGDNNIKIGKIFDVSWNIFVYNWKKLMPVFAFVLIMSAIVGGEDGKNTSSLENLVNLMWSIIQFIIIIGVVNASLKLVRGDTISFSDFWQPKYFLKILGTAILYALPIVVLFGVVLGTLFLVLGNAFNIIIASIIDPSVLAQYILPLILAFISLFILIILYSTRVYFYQFVVIDQNIWGIKALKESFKITRRKAVSIFVLILAIVLANIIGMMIFFVGLVFSLPLTFIALAYTYDQLYKDYHGTQPDLPQERPIELNAAE